MSNRGGDTLTLSARALLQPQSGIDSTGRWDVVPGLRGHIAAGWDKNVQEQVLRRAAALVLRSAMNYSYAGLWRRCLAFALDYLIIAAYLVLLGLLSLMVNLVSLGLLATLFANQLSAHITGFLLVTLPVTLYFALLEASSWQATWGKRKLGLRVIRADGAHVSVGRAVGRTVLTFIPWELAHTLIWQIRFAPATSSPLIIGGFVLVWALVGANVARLALSKTHQSIADRLAGTCVIGHSRPCER